MKGYLYGQVVLVTGACGFLGAHLVRALAQRGCVVHAFVRETSNRSEIADVPNITFWVGDVADIATLNKCCSSVHPHTIYHLAGETRARRFAGNWSAVQEAIDVNLIGTLNVVRAASECPSPPRTLVRVGGLEEYGHAPAPFSEVDREAPRSPYSASQVAATHLLQALQPHTKVAMVTLRPALIYGPGQAEDFVIPALIGALMRGEQFAIGTGMQRRDLLHVDDFTTGALAAFNRDDLAGTVLNLATGVSTAIRDVAMMLGHMVGRPELVRIGAAPDREHDIADLRGDARQAARLLGWRSCIELKDGLRTLVDWHRSRMTGAC